MVTLSTPAIARINNSFLMRDVLLSGHLAYFRLAMKALPEPKSFKRLDPPLGGISHFVDTKASPKDEPKVATVADLRFAVFCPPYMRVFT
jgi:hypothetical protein